MISLAIFPVMMIEEQCVELEIRSPLMHHMTVICGARYFVIVFFAFAPSLALLCMYKVLMSLTNTMFQQVSSFGSGQPPRPLTGGVPGRAVDDPRLVGMGGIDPGTAVKDRALGFAGGRPEVPLPPDASSTLFVEGLPANCTRREVARILLWGTVIIR